MLPTAHLAAMPYVRQVLASFGVVWSRSRLMRLAPGADVPEHADINHHWHHRVRVHIPIVTRPEVRFHCGAEVVHMAGGEAWIFDNWRRHRVENPTPDTRVHLVADTSGSAAFWSFVALSTQPGTLFREHRFDPALDARPLTEATPPPAVMEPAEVETLTRDLTMELASLDAGDEAGAQMARYAAMLEAFARDWRQLYSLHGTRPAGLPELARLRDNLRQVSRTTGARLTARTNGVEMPRVLEGKLLRALLPGEHTAQPLLSRPVFIVAAPRSGSTLLWETLATHAGLATLGGEAHWLVESDAALRPGAPGVDSNRLTAREATPEVVARIRQLAAQRAVDSQGAALTAAAALRLLEKTPKNALRIPFFERIFPDAQFIFLWRDPRENLASIIEAWDSGGWITYPELHGWQGPWSLLLPPMWQHLAGRPACGGGGVAVGCDQSHRARRSRGAGAGALDERELRGAARGSCAYRRAAHALHRPAHGPCPRGARRGAAAAFAVHADASRTGQVAPPRSGHRSRARGAADHVGAAARAAASVTSWLASRTCTRGARSAPHRARPRARAAPGRNTWCRARAATRSPRRPARSARAWPASPARPRSRACAAGPGRSVSMRPMSGSRGSMVSGAGAYRYAYRNE